MTSVHSMARQEDEIVSEAATMDITDGGRNSKHSSHSPSLAHRVPTHPLPTHQTGERGDRLHQDISVLQSSHHYQPGPTTKPRPDELDIKPFVNERPLPVPTPSREAMLTQKLEVNIIVNV